MGVPLEKREGAQARCPCRCSSPTAATGQDRREPPTLDPSGTRVQPSRRVRTSGQSGPGSLSGVEETWTSRELPVLEALVRAFDEDANAAPTLAQLSEVTALGQPQVERALIKLAAAAPPFISGRSVMELAYPARITGVTERALVATRQWPSPEDAADRLVAALPPPPIRSPKQSARASCVELQPCWAAWRARSSWAGRQARSPRPDPR